MFLATGAYEPLAPVANSFLNISDQTQLSKLMISEKRRSRQDFSAVLTGFIAPAHCFMTILSTQHLYLLPSRRRSLFHLQLDLQYT